MRRSRPRRILNRTRPTFPQRNPSPRKQRPALARIAGWLARRDFHRLLQSAAILIAGTWVGWVWLFDNWWIPRQQELFLALQPSARFIDDGAGPIRLVVTVEVHNPGKREMFLPSSMINVFGFEAEAPQLPWAYHRSVLAAGLQHSTTLEAASQGQDVKPLGVMAVGRFTPAATSVQPGETGHYEQLFYLPRTFDHLEIRVRVLAHRHESGFGVVHEARPPHGDVSITNVEDERLAGWHRSEAWLAVAAPASAPPAATTK